jgi:hypothetical protein
VENYGRVSISYLQRPLATTSYRPDIGHATIDVLPDNALLEIFDFYKDDFTNHPLRLPVTWRWKTMTHVCRRWRNIIFGSPRRLDLRLVCTNETPTRTSLGVWPPFPVIVYCENMASAVDEKGLSNTIAALEQSDRISEVYIHHINGPALEKLATVMQKPLPTLRLFHLSSIDDSVPVFPQTPSLDLPHVSDRSSYLAFHF